jgi:hypothetical protein
MKKLLIVVGVLISFVVVAVLLSPAPKAVPHAEVDCKFLADQPDLMKKCYEHQAWSKKVDESIRQHPTPTPPPYDYDCLKPSESSSPHCVAQNLRDAEEHLGQISR